MPLVDPWTTLHGKFYFYEMTPFRGPILDKISREGFESLTPEEKEILHRRNR